MCSSSTKKAFRACSTLTGEERGEQERREVQRREERGKRGCRKMERGEERENWVKGEEEVKERRGEKRGGNFFPLTPNFCYTNYTTEIMIK